jgi:Transposase DDE domain group 1
VITRLEFAQHANNPRYVVTNLTGQPQALYDDVYCQRGEAENRIRQAQAGLFATRTSYHHLQSNQLRMLLAALGYVLIDRLTITPLQSSGSTIAASGPCVEPDAAHQWQALVTKGFLRVLGWQSSGRFFENRDQKRVKLAGSACAFVLA